MEKLITGVSSFDELAEAIRSGFACIPITDILGGDERIPASCSGLLVVEGEKTELRLRSNSKLSRLEVMESLLLYSEYRPLIPSLKCTVDGKFPIFIEHSNVAHSSPTVDCGTTVTLRFVTIKSALEKAEEVTASSVYILARIDNSHLQFDNLSVTTTTECSQLGELGSSLERNGLGGDVSPYRYTIRADGPDLLIEIGLLEAEVSPSIKSDLKFLDSLVTTLVWVNGGHARKCFWKHSRDGNLISATIHPHERTTICRARLVQPTFGVNEAVQTMDCGIDFFCRGEPLAGDLKLLLWQYKDATCEGPIGLGMLLQSCTLLEGVAGLTLRHAMHLNSKMIDQLRMPGDKSGSKRKSYASERFFHAAVHLGFDWDSEMKPVVDTWTRVRNALAHGDIGKIDFTQPEGILESYRQIIVAFNAMALRLIGYPGSLVIGPRWYPFP
jgi:hypothetical protein